jgi:hypothetical protein
LLSAVDICPRGSGLPYDADHKRKRFMPLCAFQYPQANAKAWAALRPGDDIDPVMDDEISGLPATAEESKAAFEIAAPDGLLQCLQCRLSWFVGRTRRESGRKVVFSFLALSGFEGLFLLGMLL